MNPHWLWLTTFALSLYGTGQVWLVQMSSYPLWRYVGEPEFHAYHDAWWRSIWGVVLAPAVLTFAGAMLMLRWPAPGAPLWATWSGAGLQVALVAGTAAWWGPLMARLEGRGGGLDLAKHRLLMRTHWLRVALVTAYSVLLASMAATAQASA